jgi:hypothetical protein
MSRVSGCLEGAVIGEIPAIYFALERAWPAYGIFSSSNSLSPSPSPSPSPSRLALSTGWGTAPRE